MLVRIKPTSSSSTFVRPKESVKVEYFASAELDTEVMV
jgi:hypothetical protein